MLPTIKKNTVQYLRLQRLFTARCHADPALAAYPSLDAVIAALCDRDAADQAARRRLLCAVIAQQKAAPCELWSALLLHAFRGMLLRLSRSLVGVDDADDADARVATGLLHALARVRPERDPERIAMYVRQETRRAVFLALRRDSRACPYLPIDEDEAASRDDMRADEEPSEEEEDGQHRDPDAEGEADGAREEAGRDPAALARAWRHPDPDALADERSLVALEDRTDFHRPTPRSVPDEQLLRAHAVHGGLRLLTDHLFADASARRRNTIYQQLLRRTRRLLARAK